MENENNKDISLIKESLDESISTLTKAPVYQISKSAEIRNNLSTLLQNINQASYAYVLEIKNYIRNNIKDASSLKKAIIEKIQANMGE